MIALLSAEGRDALRAVAGRSVLYAFDFDGTLAGISSDRRNVTLSPAIYGWLHELAARVPCAVVSGRSLSDLTPRVNGAVPYLIGNHWLESPLTPDATLNAAERICLGWMKQLDGDLAGPLNHAGMEVENKRYTLTFHYRGGRRADHGRARAGASPQSIGASPAVDRWKSVGERPASGEHHKRGSRPCPHVSSEAGGPVLRRRR